MGLINAINCDKDTLELGIVSCEQYLTEFKTPILIRKGWRMLRTAFEALDAEGFVALVQSGDWQPVLGSKQFTNNTPDVTTQEYTGGVLSVVRNGKPQYQFDYDNGIGFHKALYSKNGFNKFDIGIVDDSGTLILALTPDGLYVTGLTAGMVNAATFTPRTGDTDSMTGFSFQLTNEQQFNRRMVTYNIDQSEVDFNDLPAVTGTTITGTATAAGIVINVRSATNVSYGIEALTAANFRVYNPVTNAAITIATVVPLVAEGTYRITTTPVLTTGTPVVVQLWDATATPPVNVALVGDNQLYKGISDLITVTAAVVMVFSMVFNSVFA